MLLYWHTEARSSGKILITDSSNFLPLLICTTRRLPLFRKIDDNTHALEKVHAQKVPA